MDIQLKLKARAIGEEGAEDVTRYYVDDWSACQARRREKGWSESFLAQVSLTTEVFSSS